MITLTSKKTPHNPSNPVTLKIEINLKPEPTLGLRGRKGSLRNLTITKAQVIPVKVGRPIMIRAIFCYIN